VALIDTDPLTAEIIALPTMPAIEVNDSLPVEFSVLPDEA
jgi:hypothetical protein